LYRLPDRGDVGIFRCVGTLYRLPDRGVVGIFRCVGTLYRLPDRGAVGMFRCVETFQRRNGGYTGDRMTTKAREWLYELEVISVTKHRLYF
jgi:hypothetical protein